MQQHCKDKIISHFRFLWYSWFAACPYQCASARTPAGDYATHGQSLIPRYPRTLLSYFCCSSESTCWKNRQELPRAKGSAYVNVTALSRVAGTAQTLVFVLRVLTRTSVLARVWITVVYINLTTGKEKCIRIKWNSSHVFLCHKPWDHTVYKSLIYLKSSCCIFFRCFLQGPTTRKFYPFIPILLLSFLWDWSPCGSLAQLVNSQEAQDLLGSNLRCKNGYCQQDHIKPASPKNNSQFTVSEQLFEWQKDI